MKATQRSIISSLRSSTGRAVTLLALLLLMLLPAAVQAQLSYTTNNGTITITGGCPGSAGAVTIPDTIDGLPVTSIGDRAFDWCTGLTSITIPDSVASIGNLAFSVCTGLSSVTMGTSVTSIGGGAFQDCTGLTSVTIGAGVTSIGDYAFRGCTGLTSVTIPNSVTTIESGAFSGCTSLTSVTIPSNVTIIGDSAFSFCKGLTSVTVDGFNAFYSSVDGVLFNKSQTTLIQCPAVKAGSYTIPNSVTNIVASAFDGCTGLTSITIPNSVTTIEWRAFADCTSLTNVTIGAGVTSIGDYAFRGCTGLTSVTIPNSVTSIGAAAFLDCISLSNVNIPDGVTSIGDYAFRGCTGLTSVTIPNSVTNIEGWAFSGCPSLNSITVDGLNAFYSSMDGVLFNKSQTTLIQCPAVKAGSYTIPNSVTNIEGWAFSVCTGLSSVTMGTSVTSIGGGAFQDCTGLTSVTIGAGVTSIGGYAFSGCTSLTYVTIPNSVTSIGDSTFSWCTGLTNVTIGNSVTSIGDSAFSFCNGLTSVTIPNSVTSIGQGAFWACGGLVYVTISSSVTSIEPNAFQSCRRLTAVTVDALNSIYGSVDGVFFDKSKSTLIQYPASKDGTSYTISDRVTSIGDSAFYDCESLTNVIIPPSVTTIGREAFEASGLTSVTIPNSVTSIGDYAFSWCSRLKGITVDTRSSSYGSVDGVLFDKRQTSILQFPGGRTGDYTIPNSVTSIGDGAFTDSSVSNVIIGDSVTSIGEGAFSWCTGLKGVYFQGNAPDANGAFDEAPETVYYLPGTTGWGAIFDGRPTALWTPMAQASDSRFGVQTNQFGFNLNWASGRDVVVEASADLANPTWSPVSTNTLINGSSYFSDPQWTNSPTRFYRLRSP